MLEAIANWVKRNKDERLAAVRFELAWIVAADDRAVVVTDPQGATSSVSWSELDRLAIETNDSGPWGADVWWVLESLGGRCVFPQGATGERETLDTFNRVLPGLNHSAIIKAMGCTSNARFVCWERHAL